MKLVISSFFILFPFFIFAQQPSFSSAEIQKQIEKVGVLNRVLYFAAHPDDENTRLIAYLSKGKNVNTAYFSLTRGDGGQNLIGDEKGALLGIIRTQELLQARKIDGGTQYFSRAIDFGYSKSATETLKHWEKDSLLADAVLVIRKFKPDVIVTRFPPDERAGHGHHTVSALIAEEAYKAAADPTRFPESANKYGAWQVEKLYWNASTWWDKTITEREDEYVVVNIGSYDSKLGVSYSEISSKSRSQHQSQGFGMSIQRGDRMEYMKLVLGDSTKKDVLQNQIRGWNAFEGGKAVTKQWRKILKSYNSSEPQKSIEDLTQLYFAILEMPENRFKNQKAKDVKNIIAACGGLWMDFRSTQALLVKNEAFSFTAYALSQSDFPYQLKEVLVNGKTYASHQTLDNSYVEFSDTISVPQKTSTPYWLENSNGNDMFLVNDRNLISNPENKSVLNAKFVFQTNQGELTFDRPLMYKWTDRVRGELYRPVNIVDPLSVAFDKKVSLAPDNQIQVRVRANEAAKNIQVQLTWGAELKDESQILTIDSLSEGQSLPLIFELNYPFKKLNNLQANVWVEETQKFSKSLLQIEYPHIQTQVVLPEAKMTLIKDSIIITRKNFGYIVGSGDEVPTALNELGCKVTFIDPSHTSLEELQKYQGIIIGIRAYNKVEAMKSLSPILNQYVFQGGFVMVQYNTNRGMVTDELGPYPFKLSRLRVTEEDAVVTRLQTNHSVLSTPNQITNEDFDNWVQERGLYFADEWDSHYTPILGWNDSGEDLTKGSLLVTEYGQGHFVFTGISFFRQLPAGVHGAYKLFGNLISYGSTNAITK